MTEKQTKGTHRAETTQFPDTHAGNGNKQKRRAYIPEDFSANLTARAASPLPRSVASVNKAFDRVSVIVESLAALSVCLSHNGNNDPSRWAQLARNEMLTLARP